MRLNPRRRWPILLAFLFVAVLGLYLVYTERLVSELRVDAQRMSRVYSSVAAGLSNRTPENLRSALIELEPEVYSTGVPIVATDPRTGDVMGGQNLPFPFDITKAEDLARVKRYVIELDRQNPPVNREGRWTIHFGASPIVDRLHWISILQFSALAIIMLTAYWIIRYNIRSERDLTWASLARESAHQMGTPLTSLSGWIEILRLPTEDRDRLIPFDQVVQAVEEDVGRLEKVSRRFEMIGRPARKTSTDLAVLLRGLETYVRRRLPHVGIDVSLSLDLQPDTPLIEANGPLLEWAFENLVKNALDALAGKGGEIRIAMTNEENGMIRIRVQDSGPGIAPEIKSRLFDAGATTKAAGWGVGLSLSRRIVEEMHGGRIELVPSAGGATFDILLPVAAE